MGAHRCAEGCALNLANNVGLCALSQRVGNETSYSGKPSRQLRDQRGHGPEETASVRRCIPDVEWFHFPLALGCIFSPPRKKKKKRKKKIYSQVFHMQTLKMKKRACILSFILHKPFTWKRRDKKDTESGWSDFEILSKVEKERRGRDYSGSFGLIKTNRRTGGVGKGRLRRF